MTSQDAAAPFDPKTLNERLLRREQLRRENQQINTNTPLGLEGALAELSAEVTADAVARLARDAIKEPTATSSPQLIPGSRPSPR